MKTTTKDCLVGIAFALGTLAVNGASYSIFSAPNHDTLGFFAIFLIELIAVPVYFICKQDRRWHYGVAVAVTNFIAMLPFFPLFIWLVNWHNFGEVICTFLIFSVGFLPPAVDLLITCAKAFWDWLGRKTAI